MKRNKWKWLWLLLLIALLIQIFVVPRVVKYALDWDKNQVQSYQKSWEE